MKTVLKFLLAIVIVSFGGLVIVTVPDIKTADIELQHVIHAASGFFAMGVGWILFPRDKVKMVEYPRK